MLVVGVYKQFERGSLVPSLCEKCIDVLIDRLILPFRLGLSSPFIDTRVSPVVQWLSSESQDVNPVAPMNVVSGEVHPTSA